MSAPGPGFAAAYPLLMAELPPALQGLGAGLPFRLGVASRREGDFGELLQLEPNLELPRFVNESPTRPDGRLVDEPTLARFLKAHYAGGLFGLLADRIADDQVVRDEALLGLRRWLLGRWVEALAQAMGNRGLARSAIAEALRDWRWGVAAERRWLRAGRLSPEDYRAITERKLRWVSCSAACLLQARGDPRARLLRRIYDRFLLGLQCLDDAVDEEEDGARLGSSVAGALGIASACLIRVAPLLVGEAGRLALGAGWPTLGDWLSQFARVCASWVPEGNRVAHELGAWALLAAFRGDGGIS